MTCWRPRLRTCRPGTSGARPCGSPRYSAAPRGTASDPAARPGRGRRAGRGYTDQQRARWVELAMRAADGAPAARRPRFSRRAGRVPSVSLTPGPPRFRGAATGAEAEAAGGVTAKEATPSWDWDWPGCPARPARRRPSRAADRRIARAGRDGELQGACQAAVPLPQPGIYDLRIRPMVACRRPGTRRRHPGPAPQRRLGAGRADLFECRAESGFQP